jgi:hypothetical protein
MGNRQDDDEKTRSDPKPFPADLLLEATLQRGQQPMHSSSRRGGKKPVAKGDRRRPDAPFGKTHKLNSGRCAVLDKPGFGLRSPPLSYGLHMPPDQQF